MCGEANGGSYFGSVGGRISVVVLGLLESILSIEKAISAGKRALLNHFCLSKQSKIASEMYRCSVAIDRL